jgi:hypothetical protein
MEAKMSKPLHPSGTHRLRLVNVLKSRYGDLMTQCIFEGTGENKGCYTLSRLISKIGRWGATSNEFLDQLEGLDSDKDLYQEVKRFIGQEFICVIPKQGKASQMNINHFLKEASNINGHLQVEDGTLTGLTQVPHV